jgi:hypothetical protein
MVSVIPKLGRFRIALVVFARSRLTGTHTLGCLLCLFPGLDSLWEVRCQVSHGEDIRILIYKWTWTALVCLLVAQYAFPGACRHAIPAADMAFNSEASDAALPLCRGAYLCVRLFYQCLVEDNWCLCRRGGVRYVFSHNGLVLWVVGESSTFRRQIVGQRYGASFPG